LDVLDRIGQGLNLNAAVQLPDSGEGTTKKGTKISRLSFGILFPGSANWH
jgi:hypothetical protein